MLSLKGKHFTCWWCVKKRDPFSLFSRHCCLVRRLRTPMAIRCVDTRQTRQKVAWGHLAAAEARAIQSGAMTALGWPFSIVAARISRRKSSNLPPQQAKLPSIAALVLGRRCQRSRSIAVFPAFNAPCPPGEKSLGRINKFVAILD